MISKTRINGQEEIIKIRDNTGYWEYMKTELCADQGVSYCSVKGNRGCPKSCGLYKMVKEE